MPEAQTLPGRGWLVILLAGLLYVVLSVHLPVSLLANTRHDDAWYFERAGSLVTGHWLGDFSQMTLMKGPGYSFFLAVNFLLGLSLILSQALLYGFACTLFALAVFRLSRSVAVSLAVFLLMLWHPAVLPVRLIRDDIYAAQTLIFLACIIHVLLLPLASRFQAGWAIAGGLSLAWLWLTREEGIWIVPAIALLCAVRLWQDRRRARPLLLLATSAALALAVVAAGNLIAYRTFAIVDFKDRAFRNALGALQSVQAGEPVPYVPVPGKVRDQLYAASPSFAALKPYFDDGGRSYRQSGCQVYPSTCGDYAGGWFVWALRDAVAWAGHYRTPGDAAAFYSQLASEVTSACGSGRLQCASGLVAYMPPVTPAQWQQLPAKLRQLVDLLLSQSPVPAANASTGSAAQLKAMWGLAGFPRRTLAPADRAAFSDTQLPIDSVDDAPATMADRYARRVVEMLSALYRICMPVLAVAAGLTYVAHIALLKRGALGADGYWWLTHMLWLLVLCRAIVLLLVDISAFPAINIKYLSAGFPLLCSALTLTIYLPFRRSAEAER